METPGRPRRFDPGCFGRTADRLTSRDTGSVNHDYVNASFRTVGAFGLLLFGWFLVRPPSKRARNQVVSIAQYETQPKN
jgi:hypothetical protein